MKRTKSVALADTWFHTRATLFRLIACNFICFFPSRRQMVVVTKRYSGMLPILEAFRANLRTSKVSGDRAMNCITEKLRFVEVGEMLNL